MSAAEALRAAYASGVRVTVDGESLVLEATGPPPDEVLDALSRYKVAVVALLREDRWTADKWRACCVVEWLNQHPAPSSPGRCAWCGKAESPGAVVLPFGTEPGTHTWLHAECWPAWHQARHAEAIAALAAIDIGQSRTT
jgi:hypothetical protein